MTIISQTADWEFTASGADAAFNINDPLPDPFRIEACLFDPVTGQRTDPSYTVTANAGFGGGTITFLSNPAAGLKVRAWRLIDGHQNEPLPTFGPLPAKVVEGVNDLASVDRLAARRFAQRALLVPDDEGDALAALPRVVDRKGRILGFDATTGQPKVSAASLAAIDQVVGNIALLALLPQPSGGKNFPRVNTDGDAYELRTPRETFGDVTEWMVDQAQMPAGFRFWANGTSLGPSGGRDAHILRFKDRIFVGAAADYNGNFPCPTDSTHWLEQAMAFSQQNGQLVVMNTAGYIGGVFASRTLDSLAPGAESSIGLMAASVNDNTSQVQTSYALYVEAHRLAGAGIAHAQNSTL